jgi:hypothetical protein
MDALIYVLRPMAFVLCLAIFMYLVVDNYFYLAGRRKKP